MNISYVFKLNDSELTFDVDVDRETDTQSERADAAEWLKLEFEQCSNCPLSKLQCRYCPVAVDLQPLFEALEAIPENQDEIEVTVNTPERRYEKKVSVEVGVRSLMGLVMATSGCPILKQLKPNARNHLPFASQEEFVIRSTAFFLLRQYFLYREGHRPDWELNGLIRLNQQLETLNQALWERFKKGSVNDSNLQVILSFFNLSSSVSSSLEEQLELVKPLLLNEELGLAIRPDDALRS